MKKLVFAIMLVCFGTIGYAQHKPAPTKPKVSIDSNYPAQGSGAVAAFKKHVQQLTQYLQTNCGLAVTIKADTADYLVKLRYEEGYWIHKSVKLEIANPDGDTISTMDNTKLEKDYQQVCSIILTDWSSRQAGGPDLTNPK